MDWDNISVDELRRNRPDIYQEIVDEVLLSAFAGRADEVYDIVLPAINEIQAEIKTVTDDLRRRLEYIVEIESRKKFKQLLAEIEQTTALRVRFQEETRIAMQNDEPKENDIKSRRADAKKVRKFIHYAHIGSIILYDGVKYTVKSKKIERGLYGLVLTDNFGRDFFVVDDPSRYEVIGKINKT